jgi:type I restriction enzyme S subunit
MNTSVPLGWKLLKLGEIADIVTGTTPSKKKIQYYGGDIPFVTPAELGDDNCITEAPTTISEMGLVVSRLLPKDTVMVSCIGTLGKIGIAGVELTTNQQINSLIFDDSIILPKYGYYACKRLKPILEALSSSTTLPIVNKSKFSKIKILVPPLEKQKRIAAILDKADAIRRKRRQAIQLADEFLQSVFLDIFGDPMVNPKGWPIHKLSTTFSHSPRIGTIKPAKEGGNHIVIRVGELGDYEVALKKCKSITLEDSELKRFKVENGDLLLARAIGSEDHLGKTSIFRGSEEHVVFDSHVMKLKFKPKVMKPEFFLFWLKSKGGRTRFMRKAGKTAVQFNVNAKQISDIDIPLPPITLQATFNKLISQSRGTVEKLEKSIEMTDLLLASLTQRAFRGDL